MNMTRRPLIGALACVVSALALGTAAKADWREEVPVFRIGILGGALGEHQLKAFACLDQLVEQTMQLQTELYTSPNYDGVMQGLLDDALDTAWLGAASYAGVYLRDPDAVEPLVAVKQEDGSVGYHSVLVVRADSPYQTLDDLRGRSVMFTDRDSTSGFLVPNFELSREGYPLRHFGSFGFSGSHPATVDSVLNGQFDAGVTWTSGIGRYEDGYSRGNLHRMVERGQLNMSDLRILWTSSLIAEGPVVVRKALPQEAKDLYRQLLIDLPEQHQSCFEAIAGGAALGYQPVDHELYRTIIDLRRELEAG
jgi:phosphonate transport system substrate-binding protein